MLILSIVTLNAHEQSGSSKYWSLMKGFVFMHVDVVARSNVFEYTWGRTNGGPGGMKIRFIQFTYNIVWSVLQFSSHFNNELFIEWIFKFITHL